MRLKKIATFGLSAIMLIGAVACNESALPKNAMEKTLMYSTAPLPAENEAFIGVEKTTGGNVGEVKLEKGDLMAVITIKGYGDITVKLLPECAPVAVQNFVNYANEGYYDGKLVHRVIGNFMIQGGSPTGNGTSLEGETTFGVERAYNARHFYGALSMANSMGRNSQQFFIINSKEDGAPEQFIDAIPTLNENVDYYKEALESGELNEFQAAYAQSLLNNDLGMIKYAENLTDEVITKYKNGGSAFLDGGYTVFGQMVEGFFVLDEVSKVETTAQSADNDERSKPVKDVVIESVKIYKYNGE